jgi:hypothetical protein
MEKSSFGSSKFRLLRLQPQDRFDQAFAELLGPIQLAAELNVRNLWESGRSTAVGHRPQWVASRRSLALTG